MSKLQELQQRLDLMQCDSDSMLELVNIVKELIEEVSLCDLSQK